jgi:pyruvate formate lyase activating enzyme
MTEDSLDPALSLTKGASTPEAERRRERAADAFYILATLLCLLLAVLVALRASPPAAGHAGAAATAAGAKRFRDPFTRPDVKPIAREEVLARQLSLHEARYYKKLDGNEVQCELCPTLCRLRDGQRGQCRVRVNYAGALYSLVYGRLVAEHDDPIEKKPLYHFLPTSRVYSIATVGCNLSCVFCQNWQISQAFPEQAPFLLRPPEQAVRMARQIDTPSIAYTYTEPAVFFEYMVDAARLAREQGVANVWVTCGYLNEEPLREFAKVLDAANVDIKGFREDFYATWCNAQLAPVLRTLEVLKEMKVHIEITNLLIPGGNDDPEMIRTMCRWIRERIGPQTPVHFTRYHPAYKLERPGPTPLSTLRRAWSIAIEEGLKYIYTGNVADPEGSMTSCAGCGRRLIERRGFHVMSNDVRNGACPGCGARIPGVWPAEAGKPWIRVPVDEPVPAKKE